MADTKSAGQVAMQNIVRRMDEMGINASEFARRMGVLPAHVANWKKRGLPAERLRSAADVLGISIDEITGRVKMVPENAIPINLTGHIPVIGFSRLGDEGFYEVSQVQEEGYINIPSKDPKAYALRCEGTSMMPRIQPGEYVIAEPSYSAQAGDEVVVQSTDGRVMVKRMLYWRDDHLHLGSINSDHSTIILHRSEIRDVHPVLAIIPKRFLNL